MAAELDLAKVDATDEDTDAAPAATVPLAGRIRVLVFAAIGPLITGYAAVAAIMALVTAVASRAHFSTIGVLGAALPGWLAAHQVPLLIGGHELGALPLLPTIGAVALVARTAAGAADRLAATAPRQAVQVVAAIATAHGIFGLVLALSGSGRPVTADPLAGLCYPVLIAALAATLGVARRCGLIELAREHIDAAAARALRAGVLAVAALLTAGALVVLLGMVTSVGTARTLFADNAAGLGNGLGAFLLSAGYLPNAVIAGTSFVAGPGFSLGEVAFAPLHFAGGAVPGLPLLAALPEKPAMWWPVLFALPLGVGVLVGVVILRDAAEDPMVRLRAVGIAAVVVAVSFAALAGSAGGRLGSGPFDPLDLRAAALSLALVAWIAVPGAAVAWFGGPHPVRDGGGLLDDGLGDEPGDEPDDLDDGPAVDDVAEEDVAEPEPADEAEPTDAEAPAEDLPKEID